MTSAEETQTKLSESFKRFITLTDNCVLHVVAVQDSSPLSSWG